MAENTRTQNSANSCPVAVEWPGDWSGRAMFLSTLQRFAPKFWRELNEMWKAGEELTREWLEDHNVRDGWLAQAVAQTVWAWNADPSGPSATLTRGYSWYFFSVQGDREEVPDFAPKLEKPYPTYKTEFDYDELLVASHKMQHDELLKFIDEIEIESLEEFEKRMTLQFKAQLKAYIKRVRGVVDYGKKDQRALHAQWTALVFMGRTRVEIARTLPSCYKDSLTTVTQAVRRFAKEIELTLPS